MSMSGAEFTLVPRQVAGESRSGDLLAIVICMAVFGTLVLLLRIWSRIGLQQASLAGDDFAILASWAFVIAFTVNVCIQTKYGLGKHIKDLPATTDFSASLRLFYFGEATYYIAVSLTKISILFLYLRLIPQKNYRIASYILMAFVGLTCFTSVVAGIFQCSPIHRAWDPTVKGTCFNQVALYTSNAGLNIAQDFIIYFLPVKRFWEIQIPRRQRIALILVFVFGAFVCITGILRLQWLRLASVSQDPTWDNYGAAIWSSIESNTGLVCASLVHLKPIFTRFAPSVLSMTRATRLSDGPSAGTDGHKIQSGRRSALKRPEHNGAISEIELEENNESNILRPVQHTMNDNYSESSDSFHRNVSGHPLNCRIHKSTQFDISYGKSSKH